MKINSKGATALLALTTIACTTGLVTKSCVDRNRITKENTEIKNDSTKEDTLKTASLNACTVAGRLHSIGVLRNNTLGQILSRRSNNDGGIYSACNIQTLDKFVIELYKTGDDINKKQALFRKYAGTKDIELAKSLAVNNSLLYASDDDIITLINNNGLDVINSLPLSSELEASEKTSYSKKLINTVSNKIIELTKKDKNNTKNIENLDTYFTWINLSDKTQAEKSAAKQNIINGYFENKDGKILFKPSVKPSKRDIKNLLYEYQYDEKGNNKIVPRPQITPEMKKAINAYNLQK